MKRFFILLVLILSGCAGTYYVSPTHYETCHANCNNHRHIYHSNPYWLHWNTSIHTQTIVIQNNNPNKPNRPNRPNRPNNKPPNKIKKR